MPTLLLVKTFHTLPLHSHVPCPTSAHKTAQTRVLDMALATKDTARAKRAGVVRSVTCG